MPSLRLSLTAFVLCLLAACAGPGPEAQGWRVTETRVEVPDTLSVAMDGDTWVPETDINWWQEEGKTPEDRRAQVGAILREGAEQGLSGLSGSRPVVAELRLLKFHAVTPRARTTCAFGLLCLGTTPVDFRITLRDPATGEALASGLIAARPETVQGSRALTPELSGATDRGRIVAEIAAKIRAWAGGA